MIGEYRFFQDYFDGQIVTKESEKFKLFKILLVSIATTVGLFLVLAGFCNIAEFILLELGMLWNIYLGLNKKSALILGFIVGLLYFFFASNFAIYANGFIYVACYIPLQLIAVSSKDYEDGDFIQVKKRITDLNKILFVIFFGILCVTLVLFDANVGGKFIVLDGLSASLLVCSAILRNERYTEYYIFRIFALIMTILLWIGVAIEFGVTGTIAIIIMYFAYLVFDVVNLIYQFKTYKNEYMLVIESYQKAQDDEKVKEKLKIYKKNKQSKND